MACSDAARRLMDGLELSVDAVERERESRVEEAVLDLWGGRGGCRRVAREGGGGPEGRVGLRAGNGGGKEAVDDAVDFRLGRGGFDRTSSVGAGDDVVRGVSSSSTEAIDEVNGAVLCDVPFWVGRGPVAPTGPFSGVPATGENEIMSLLFLVGAALGALVRRRSWEVSERTDFGLAGMGGGGRGAGRPLGASAGKVLCR